MKKITLLLFATILHLAVYAQGWPYDYEGVMMQGFYWNSYDETSWSKLEGQAEDIAPYFDLIWVPQSGWCNSDYSMGYMPVYYFNQKSAFGSEAQLRSMIATYRQKGTGFIADVVINHRKNIGKNESWVDFPEETWNGKTYKMTPTDICGNDDGGTTANWASENGLSLSINNDTGDDFSGSRDLDHQNPHVQEIIKDYLKFLHEDIGYVGFRYDMVKGFWASFVGDYNMSARPAFSVGEFFDGATKIKEWINYSKGYVAEYPTSAAFDFPFRFCMRNVIEDGKWRHLGEDEQPLAFDDYYKQYAVTFIENHDTEYRNEKEPQAPIWRDTLAANAYLLAMPGTPCVFYRHWHNCMYPIKQMILARRLAGITNTSGSEEKWRDDLFYAKASYGKRGTLLCVVGSYPYNYYADEGNFTEFLSGKGYRYLLNKSANTVWMDVPDGTYDGSINVKFTKISNISGAKIVYTTDGTIPTAESTQIGNGETLLVDSSCTITAGLLANGNVRNIQTRKYNIFKQHDITIYVSTDVSWANLTFYMWDNNSKELNGSFPGKRVATSKNLYGKKWYYKTFTRKSPDQYVNLIVSNLANTKKTIEKIGIREDCYLVINGDKNGDLYLMDDQTEFYTTGVEELHPTSPMKNQHSAYNLQGIPVQQGQKKGIIIENGRKVAY